MILMSPVSGIAQDEPVTTTYAPADAPNIEILVGEEWLPGQLRSWVERGGVQWASVEYGVSSSQNRIALVPLPRLRAPVLIPETSVQPGP